ncbi:GNAT family N-acetyltransferase [Streptomyces kanamyceticus]|uniref:GNAT family N-acetyltransferase n=1 Tax=Streptomyces kanamyceticus TaxID=1967 RepID=A0A5J6G5D3_STRKN|nr:GNAT family N-acetyltransferase [Streptomyces kanamyceticus]QEU90173.1 GNAT family N-acetyltransferase [Streptomyces kanamyceticus]
MVLLPRKPSPRAEERRRKLAGFTEYHRYGTEIVFIHTEIDPRFEGRGLGGVLARAALDAAREQGLAVLPFCRPGAAGATGAVRAVTRAVPETEQTEGTRPS